MEMISNMLASGGGLRLAGSALYALLFAYAFAFQVVWSTLSLIAR